MLENEPKSGAEGTAGTTETSDTATDRVGTDADTGAHVEPEEEPAGNAGGQDGTSAGTESLTTAPPQEAEVKVGTPSRRSGAMRAAGPDRKSVV